MPNYVLGMSFLKLLLSLYLLVNPLDYLLAHE